MSPERIFSNNLIRLREAKGLNQFELSKASAIGLDKIRRFETSKSTPSVIMIRKLCSILECSSSDLIGI